MVLLGVAERRLLRKVAEVAAMLGIRRGLVVCSRDGMD
jgi:anthranilate phosphoribosyltransferase